MAVPLGVIGIPAGVVGTRLRLAFKPMGVMGTLVNTSFFAISSVLAYNDISLGVGVPGVGAPSIGVPGTPLSQIGCAGVAGHPAFAVATAMKSLAPASPISSMKASPSSRLTIGVSAPRKTESFIDGTAWIMTFSMSARASINQFFCLHALMNLSISLFAKGTRVSSGLNMRFTMFGKCGSRCLSNLVFNDISPHFTACLMIESTR